MHDPIDTTAGAVPTPRSDDETQFMTWARLAVKNATPAEIEALIFGAAAAATHKPRTPPPPLR